MTVASALDVHVHGQHAGAVRPHVHQRTHGLDTDLGPRVKPDWTPDAGVSHVDAPIPAEGVAGLTNLVEGVMLGVWVVAAALFLGVGEAHGRHERHGKRVLAVAQVGARIPAIGAVEVAGIADDQSVERHVGHGVEAVGHQIVAVVAVAMPVEFAGEAPVDVADPLLLGLVVAVEGIVDESGIEQVDGGFTGDRGGDAGGEQAMQGLGRKFRVQRGERPTGIQWREGVRGVGGVGGHKKSLHSEPHPDCWTEEIQIR